MSDLRTVAQQALEALDESLQMLLPKAQSDKCRRASFALRAALAEPVQEPVAWLHEWKPNAPVIGKSLHWLGSSPHGDDVKVTPLYTAPPPPQRKPLTDEEIIRPNNLLRRCG
jgi:hypothetical protein